MSGITQYSDYDSLAWFYALKETGFGEVRTYSARSFNVGGDLGSGRTFVACRKNGVRPPSGAA